MIYYETKRSKGGKERTMKGEGGVKNTKRDHCKLSKKKTKKEISRGRVWKGEKFGGGGKKSKGSWGKQGKTATPFARRLEKKKKRKLEGGENKKAGKINWRSD